MVWLIVAAAALGGAAADAVPCERLPSLCLPDAAAPRAEPIAAGTFRTYEHFPRSVASSARSRPRAIRRSVSRRAAGRDGAAHPTLHELIY
jgi:hypothetical protein